jgi:hypothetical protein
MTDDLTDLTFLKSKARSRKMHSKLTHKFHRKVGLLREAFPGGRLGGFLTRVVTDVCPCIIFAWVKWVKWIR